ncbi:MAG: ribbon-helix-helix protein, CopG family [Chloroflexi bacterium]|nr:ribbon-helix-helix protein, CopG family [Chloroflexota bacterium]
MNRTRHDAIIKFLAAEELKRVLQQLANARGVSLSALIRLVMLEYVKHKT